MSRGLSPDAELGIDPRAEARADILADARDQRRRTGCACFAPGEASGTCPGQAACPMACDEPEDDDEGSEVTP